MRGMIILQGDEEGQYLFMEKLNKIKKSKNLIFYGKIINEFSDLLLNELIEATEEYVGFNIVAKGLDCKTTKYLQDYHSFYVVKVNSCMCNNVENNYRDGKFLLGCKSDSFESDIDEVLRLISI